MKKVTLDWSNICVLHKHELIHLSKCSESLKKNGIDLEIRHYGIGYPNKMSEYYAQSDCQLPDIIITTDLEVFENNVIFNKFKNDLYNIKANFKIKKNIENSAINQFDNVLPFIVIPIVLSSNYNEKQFFSLKDMIDRGVYPAIGGINNSGAKCVIKALWSEYGKEYAEKMLKNSKILDMPIQAFHQLKTQSSDYALIPTIYALRANNQMIASTCTVEGAVALPSFICIRNSIDIEVGLEVLNSILTEDFCNFFVSNANIYSCIEGTKEDEWFNNFENKFLYPSQEFFSSVSGDEFYDLYKANIEKAKVI